MTSIPILSPICTLLERLLGAICLFLVLAIPVLLGTQVFFRYVFSTSIGPTDELATYALIWLTFLGIAWIYRRREHIAVDVAGIGGPGPVARALRILGDVIVAATSVIMIFAIADSAPMARRITMGVMQVSRFWMHYFPLALGLGLIVFFCVEKVLLAVVNAPDVPATEPEATEWT
ncbi:TRAP transporter small permease [uncultured Maritimibacter sp.]|jgi:TRAP-type C4-dicarboxylate transport system permease small subunit|uniref:TRAP transporter small permease n=1 Tax=uncultured Maritimibacter sp. TaxID=991866 RepID=UPI00262EC05D|nr:TRAP transporter small permease [uncultured Maritimibacter sp.]